MQCVGLQCVIVVFPDYTHLLFASGVKMAFTVYCHQRIGLCLFTQHTKLSNEMFSHV